MIKEKEKLSGDTITYLQMIQAAIDRMSTSSAIFKGFAATIVAGVGSPESVMSRDIRNIVEKGFLQYFSEVEASVLSDTFWNITLPQNLETTSVNSPAFNTFLAAQCNLKSNSLFMNGTLIVETELKD